MSAARRRASASSSWLSFHSNSMYCQMIYTRSAVLAHSHARTSAYMLARAFCKLPFTR